MTVLRSFDDTTCLSGDTRLFPEAIFRPSAVQRLGFIVSLLVTVTPFSPAAFSYDFFSCKLIRLGYERSYTINRTIVSSTHLATSEIITLRPSGPCIQPPSEQVVHYPENVERLPSNHLSINRSYSTRLLNDVFLFIRGSEVLWLTEALSRFDASLINIGSIIAIPELFGLNEAAVFLVSRSLINTSDGGRALQMFHLFNENTDIQITAVFSPEEQSDTLAVYSGYLSPDQPLSELTAFGSVQLSSEDRHQAVKNESDNACSGLYYELTYCIPPDYLPESSQ